MFSSTPLFKRQLRIAGVGVALLALASVLSGCGHKVSNDQAVAGAGSSTPSGTDATMYRDVDGDTIVALVNGKQVKIRFIGMDTPETVKPNTPVQCFGEAASNETKSLLPKGTPLRLVYDVDRKDVYGRTLAYVYRRTDGMFINEELVRQGFAVQLTIPPNVAHVDEFSQLVDQARQANIGLWAACPQ